MSQPTPDYTSLVKEIRSNFETRKSYPIEYRLQQLQALRAGLRAMEKDILAACHKDLRRHDVESFLGEIMTSFTELDFAVEHLAEWMKPDSHWAPAVCQPGTLKCLKQPKGVTLIIAPWNFPVFLALSPLVAAIAAGCAAVIKPSEMAPACSKVLFKLVSENLDQELYRVVEGDIPETTALLAQRWNHILYTGNGVVGKIVARAAAESLCSSTLELGGKSPVYIAEDANVRVAARRVAGTKMFNNGQVCIAPDYVLCHEKVLDQFLAEVKIHTDLCLTNDAQKIDSLTRIVNARHFDRLSRALSEDHGGRVVQGGLTKADKQDLFIPLTVVLNPKPESKLLNDEIFGPVLPVVSVKSLEEALKIINAKDSSLASYVYTQSSQTSDAFIKHTNSGGSAVNDCVLHISSPHVPFGGHSGGGSGYGAYHGVYGFNEFTHMRIEYNRSTMLDPQDRYLPYDAGKIDALRFLFVDGIPQYVKTGVQVAALGGLALMLRAKL